MSYHLFSMNSDRGFEVLLTVFFASTVIMGLALIVVRLMRHRSGAEKFAVWQAAFGLTFCLVPGALFLPKFSPGLFQYSSAYAHSATNAELFSRERYSNPELSISDHEVLSKDAGLKETNLFILERVAVAEKEAFNARAGRFTPRRIFSDFGRQQKPFCFFHGCPFPWFC